MSDSIQIKLKHIAITAEELLADLRKREGGVSEVDRLRAELAEVRAERDNEEAKAACAREVASRALQGLTSSGYNFRGQRIREVADLAEMYLKVKAERDALRARIDGGVDVTLTGETARLIDRQPIAQDERKGDRRRYKEETTCDEESGIRYWFDKSHHIRDEQRTNDRRRTDGTMADRRADQ